jgi:hypothetical protein
MSLREKTKNPMDRGMTKGVAEKAPSICFGFLTENATEEMPHIQHDVLEEKRHTQYSRHNCLDQVTAASGIDIKQMLDHEK